MVTNVVIAGLGGQGVLKASDILADAVFSAGFDVKKSEVHGMAQRGGSVCSEVRFGSEVLSPMITPGEADYLIILAADQIEFWLHMPGPEGVIITPESVDAKRLPAKRSLNVALLGCLSLHLDVPLEFWMASLRRNFDEKFFEDNKRAFELGRLPLKQPFTVKAKL